MFVLKKKFCTYNALFYLFHLQCFNIYGENLLDLKMYDNWLFFSPCLFPPEKEGRRKEEWISKACFKQVFLVIHSIFISSTACLAYYNKNDFKYVWRLFFNY